MLYQKEARMINHSMLLNTAQSYPKSGLKAQRIKVFLAFNTLPTPCQNAFALLHLREDSSSGT